MPDTVPSSRSGSRLWWYLAGSATFIIALALVQEAVTERREARSTMMQSSFAPELLARARHRTIAGVTAGGLVVDLKRIGYACRPHTGDDGHICTDGEAEVVVLRGDGGGAKRVSCSVETGRTYPWNIARTKCDPIVELVYESDAILRDRILDATLSWKGERIAIDDEVSSFTASHAGDNYSYEFAPGLPDG